MDPRLEPPLTLDTAFLACLVAVFFTFLRVWRVLFAVIVCTMGRIGSVGIRLESSWVLLETPLHRSLCCALPGWTDR